ncbi:MAG TPA: membrane dipeptidase, partial [SAR86 cluster bacterium]|nr:membrane dipeptidase [SAR86 cluster bacterium]
MTEKTSGSLDKHFSLMSQAQAIHTSALTLDAHADIEIPGKPSNYAGKDGLSKVAPSKMRAGGLDAVVMTVAVGPMPRNSEGYAAAKALAETKLAAVKTIVANKDNNATIILSSDELITAHKNGELALILGFQNGLILGTNLNELDTLYSSGVRVFALTHMGHNDFADSSRTLFDSNTGTREPDAEHGGLSALGKS